MIQNDVRWKRLETNRKYQKTWKKIVTSIHQQIFSPLIQNFVLFDVIWKGRLGNLHEHWNVIRDKHDLSRFGDFHEKFFFPFLYFFISTLPTSFMGAVKLPWNPLRLFANPISHSTFHSTNLKWTPVPVFVTFC